MNQFFRMSTGDNISRRLILRIWPKPWTYGVTNRKAWIVPTGSAVPGTVWTLREGKTRVLGTRHPTKGKIFILRGNVLTCLGKGARVQTANAGGSSATSWHFSDRALWTQQTLNCPRRVTP